MPMPFEHCDWPHLLGSRPGAGNEIWQLRPTTIIGAVKVETVEEWYLTAEHFTIVSLEQQRGANG